MRRSGSELGISRRAFLSTLAVPLLAGGCRRRYDAKAFRLPPISTVGLFAAGSYAIDLADLISRALRELEVDVRGRRVLLKPNMVEYEAGTIINTHPLVVAGAIVAFRRAGAREVVVGEGPGHRRDIEYLLTATGLDDHLRELDVPFVDLNHDDVEWVRPRSWFTGLDELALPAQVLRSDFIVSMPKLKTHHWAGMTCCMKNLFGVVPGAVYGWPKNLLHLRGIHPSIVDLNATIRPHFAIVDAITAMEGDGPIMGSPRHLGFVAMGTDLVALDATCAGVIGLDAARLRYLATAGRFLGNIGEAAIEHRGERPERYRTRFEVVEHLRHLTVER